LQHCLSMDTLVIWIAQILVLQVIFKL
jgi:hypothetical protein